MVFFIQLLSVFLIGTIDSVKSYDNVRIYHYDTLASATSADNHVLNAKAVYTVF